MNTEQVLNIVDNTFDSLINDTQSYINQVNNDYTKEVSKPLIKLLNQAKDYLKEYYYMLEPSNLDILEDKLNRIIYYTYNSLLDVLEYNFYTNKNIPISIRDIVLEAKDNM